MHELSIVTTMRAISQCDVDDDETVRGIIKKLNQYRKEFEQQGRYELAKFSKLKIEELKQHEEKVRRSTIESRQIAENLGLEEAHMMETQRFNQIWRERIEEYQYNTNLSLRAMEERHRKENEELKQSTLSAPKRNYKFSKDVLHLRKLQEYYAKQQDYDQAEIMQEKVRKREQLELIEAGRKNQMKLKQLQSKLSKRHEAELNAQMKRRNAGKEDLLRQRDSELSVLIQRYNNLKSEQKHQHKLESIEVLKYTAKGSTKMKSIQGRSEEKR